MPRVLFLQGIAAVVTMGCSGYWHLSYCMVEPSIASLNVDTNDNPTVYNGISRWYLSTCTVRESGTVLSFLDRVLQAPLLALITEAIHPQYLYLDAD
jgi:hypothetical protein